jgi:hypothetical protein
MDIASATISRSLLTIATAVSSQLVSMPSTSLRCVCAHLRSAYTCVLELARASVHENARRVWSMWVPWGEVLEKNHWEVEEGG